MVESGVINENTLCVGMARVGRDDQLICVDTIKNMADVDMGEPLHSLIVAGKLHPLEIDFLKLFYTNEQTNGDFERVVELHNKYFSSH